MSLKFFGLRIVAGCSKFIPRSHGFVSGKLVDLYFVAGEKTVQSVNRINETARKIAPSSTGSRAYLLKFVRFRGSGHEH